MNCGVLGVGANNDPGEVPGELGEKEMKQLETQVRCVSLQFLVVASASHL